MGSGSTESGAYTLLGGTPVPSNAASITRNAGAKWFLPSENEWYKAAYHQPAALGGDSSDYWLYPTQTNVTPDSAPPPGANAPGPSNTANIHRDDGVSNGYNDGYAVTGSPWHEVDQNFLTDVGAYTLSTSFYGTFDQAGNVFEWVEQAVGSQHRVLRGGGWLDFEPFGAEFIAAYHRGQTTAHQHDLHIGFRIATVPEPSTLVLTTLGLAGLLGWRRAASGVFTSRQALWQSP